MPSFVFRSSVGHTISFFYFCTFVFSRQAPSRCKSTSSRTLHAVKHPSSTTVIHSILFMFSTARLCSNDFAFSVANSRSIQVETERGSIALVLTGRRHRRRRPFTRGSTSDGSFTRDVRRNVTRRYLRICRSSNSVEIVRSSRRTLVGGSSFPERFRNKSFANRTIVRCRLCRLVRFYR